MADSDSADDGALRDIVGRTRGLLRTRLRSMMAGSSDLLTGISCKLESLSVPGAHGRAPVALMGTPVTLEMLVGSDGASGAGFGDLRLPSFASHDIQSAGSSTSSLALSERCELRATGPDPYDKLRYKTEAPGSSGSDGDGYGPSTSLDLSEGQRFWVRSGSEGSVQSWASSLSLDSQSDAVTAEAVEFMRSFVAQLFASSSAIPLPVKAEFGRRVQHESGRLWFARLVSAQRGRHQRVDESTFFSLVQHFALVLFECADADDFSPAKSLMNMCFTFYHEVDAGTGEPQGCVRREYLAASLRAQPIWHSLRFWNAAFFDALQCARVHRPIATRDDVRHNSLEALTDEKQYQDNVTFGQLAAFTCNMHAFGLERQLCTDFLRKQCVIANLRPDQETMLRDNVDRMYSEADPWR